MKRPDRQATEPRARAGWGPSTVVALLTATGCVVDQPPDEAAPAQIAEEGGDPAPRRALAVRLARELEAQDRDDAWASAVEDELRNALEERPSTLTSVECRTSMCVLRVEHANVPEKDAFMSSVGLHAPWNRAGARFHDGSPERSLLFLARRGSRLLTNAQTEDDNE